MLRVVEPELLDELPAQAPDAQRSRCDLVRINALMGHAEMIRKHLQRSRAKRVVDIGAGDGTLLASALKGISGIQEVVLVDRQIIVSDRTLTALRSRAGKITVLEADVFQWLRSPPNPSANLVHAIDETNIASESRLQAESGEIVATAIIANLFLHHFQGTQLGELLKLAADRCDLFIACEPRRGAWPGFAASLLGLIGCNRVTRHDARISVRAGFRDRELSAIWPDPDLWQIEEREAGLFSHLFVVRRSA